MRNSPEAMKLSANGIACNVSGFVARLLLLGEERMTNQSECGLNGGSPLWIVCGIAMRCNILRYCGGKSDKLLWRGWVDKQEAGVR